MDPTDDENDGRRNRRLITPSGVVTTILVVALVVGLSLVFRAVHPAQRPSFGSATAGAAGATPTGAGTASSPSGADESDQPDGDEITVAFAGDVQFAGRVAARLSDPPTAFGAMTSVLSRADLAMVNLDTAITTRGTPEPKKSTFRAPATAIGALQAAGVDVASMANNHAVDFGAAGLQDTLAAAAAHQFPLVGIGVNAGQAYAPWYATVGSHRVAILAVDQFQEQTLARWTAGTAKPGIAAAAGNRLLAAVRDARKKADVVVVYVNWGKEGNQCPQTDQRTLAQQLAAAGADAVIGTHAHLLQGAGWLGSTYVAYGLGNFMWWKDADYSNDTGVLTVTFRGRLAVHAQFTPARINTAGVPVQLTGSAGAALTTAWERLRGCAGLSAIPATR